MVGVDRVGAPGKVKILALILSQHIVGAVLQPPERDRGPVLVSFGGVIEHHIEDHLDARFVQCLDHVAHLVHHSGAPRCAGIALVGREIGDRA